MTSHRKKYFKPFLLGICTILPFTKMKANLPASEMGVFAYFYMEN